MNNPQEKVGMRVHLLSLLNMYLEIEIYRRSIAVTERSAQKP